MLDENLDDNITDDKGDPEIESMEIEDESGEKVQVVKKEALEKYQAELKTIIDEMGSQVKTLKTELEKEKGKDKNFNKLRNLKLSELSEEEKKGLTEKEQAILEKQETLENRIQSFEVREKETYKDESLRELAVFEEDERKKVLANFNRLTDPASTRAEIASKMTEAYRMTYGTTPGTSAGGLNEVVPFSGSRGAGGRKEPGFADTPQGKALAKKLNLGISKEAKE